MGRLSQRIRQTNKQGKMFPATVLDHGGGKVTVRLSGNGAVYRMLPMVGGPVTTNQRVHVDFNTDPPQVVAPGADVGVVGEPRSRTRVPPRGTQQEVFGDMIRRYESGTRLVDTYPVTEAGLAEAISDAQSYDLILMPPCDLTPTDFALPSRVTLAGDLRDSVILHCQITMASNSKLNRFTNIHTSGSAGDNVAVVVNGSGITIDDMTVRSCQCLSGNSYGIKVTSGAVSVTNSNISGETSDGTAYGVNVISGSATVRQTTVYGTTEQYNGSVYVYNTVLGESSCDCPGIMPKYGTLYLNPTARTIPIGTTGFTEIARVDLTTTHHNYLVLGATTNYVFWFSTDGQTLYRCDLEGGSPESILIDPTSGNTNDASMWVMSDTLVYVAYHQDDKTVVLAKYDFTTTPTRTSVLTWDGTAVSATSITGTWDYDLSDVINLVGNNEDTRLVIFTVWRGTGGNVLSTPYMMRVFTIDLTDETEVASPFVQIPDVYTSSAYQSTSTPYVYGTKIVVMTSFTSAAHRSQALVVEPATGGVTVVNEANSQTYAPSVGTAFDYDSGSIYFMRFTWGVSQYEIVKMDITGSPPYSFSVVETGFPDINALIGPEYDFFTDGRVAIFDNSDPSPAALALRLYPPGTTDFYTASVDSIKGTIDSERAVYWRLDQATLTMIGAPFAGGSGDTISLTFTGGTPFDFSPDQNLYGGALLGDRLFMAVRSDDNGANYQLDLIVLERD